MFKIYEGSYRMFSVRNILKIRRHCSNLAPVQKPATVISPKFVSEFNTFYPKLVDSVLDQIKYLEHEEVRKRMKSVAEEYPLIKIAKQGEFLVFVYELLEKPENINEKKIHQAYVLGVLQEIVQAYFLIADDVLDQSERRNLKKCWYLLPEVSNLAMNDISLFRSFTFEMLKQNIDDEFYLKVMDCTEEMFLNTEIAQHLNAITKDFKDFKIDVYDRTQIYKASKYALASPINLALILSNKANEKSFQLVEDLCNDLGVMVQINNDFTEYLDYRRKFTIKSGTDIKKRICSWSAVTALQHFNADQRKIFEENYGKWDSECEKRVVNLYDEVNLEKFFIIERESRYKRFLKKVEKLPNDSVPSPQVFRKILEFFRSYSDDLNKYYYV